MYSTFHAAEFKDSKTATATEPTNDLKLETLKGKIERKRHN